MDAAILGLPMAGINWGLQQLSQRLTSQPWHIVWFMAPLALATWMGWRQLRRRGDFRIRGPMLLFLIGYLLLFTLAAGSNVLVWKRSTIAFDEAAAPRSWLLPARWGDWRYRFARRPPHDDRLLLVTMQPPPSEASLDQVRLTLTQLIGAAARDGALGIAFDFYFGKERSDVDGFLCAVVNSSGIPVIAGQRVVRGETGLVAEDYADSIEPCFPADRRGYLLGYRDADGVVRNVVLGARLITRDAAALSRRVARELSPDRPLPTDTLVQFVEPRDSAPTLEYERLGNLRPDELHGWISGRFLLVGERSPAETFHTPFGDRLGVEVHAAAVVSLLAGTGIEHSPWWSGWLIIFVACYLIVALAADGASARKLLTLALGMSAFLLAAAALAMRLWQVWLDVIYPLVAVWGLLGLLLLLRRNLGATA